MVLQMSVASAALASVMLFLHLKELRRKWNASRDYHNMGLLYCQLRDDSSMNSEKWKELLPIFEYAEERYLRLHPYAKVPLLYSEAVKDEIDDLPCQHVGSL